MLNDVVIVASAVSAFNNAALQGPAFLWWAILALPLFVGAFLCGGYVAKRFGWTRDVILSRVSVWVALLTFLWIVLLGGNYFVLRDGASVLPMMNAVIVFLCALFVSSHMWDSFVCQKKWKRVSLMLALLLMVGLSDVHTWWGPLLQIGAMGAGVLLGRFAQNQMRPMAGIVLITTMTVVAILMQPEFYRFGQLGNLTVAHLLGVMMIGIFGTATVAIGNVCPCGKIAHGVFVKLKWLLRVICLLSMALFLLTEAVPLFLGILVAWFVLLGTSVLHKDAVCPMLRDKLFALMLMSFGVVTVMPAVTVFGILYWVNTPRVEFWREFRALL